MIILIKGMEMPKNCAECPCLRRDCKDIVHGYMCNITLGIRKNLDMRPKWCPLVEVSNPHGNLIDIDSKITVAIKDGLKVTTVKGLLNDTAVRLPKTVIEYEDGE